MIDQEPCGEEFEIDAVDLMAWGKEQPISTIEGVTLVCSLPAGHQPDDIHSDGVNDWRSE